MIGFDTDNASPAKTIDFHAQSLSLAYDDHEIIHQLSLIIPPQQITALVGPNGSGKSTL